MKFKDWENWPDLPRFFGYLVTDLYKDMKKLFSNIYDNTSLILREIFRVFPRNLFYFFKNLKEFLPILWRDRDWDHGFLMSLLEFKLKKMEKYLDKSEILEDGRKYALEIHEVLMLIETYNSNYYFDMAHEEIERKWGKQKRYTREDENGNVEWLIMYENETSENEKECEKDRRRIMDKAKEAERKNWNAIWEKLSKNLETWWE